MGGTGALLFCGENHLQFILSNDEKIVESRDFRTSIDLTKKDFLALIVR